MGVMLQSAIMARLVMAGLVMAQMGAEEGVLSIALIVYKLF